MAITHEPKESNDDPALAEELATYAYQAYNEKSPEGAALPPAEASSLIPGEGLLLPHGMRAFNRRLAISTIQARFKVPSKHQKTVDKLFSPAQQCSVKFSNFRALWESAGGKIEGDHGGSHRRLVDSDGNTVTGIFTKGEGTVYGKKSVQYLQAALNRIGVYPTK
jgi:hypothetical protein